MSSDRTLGDLLEGNAHGLGKEKPGMPERVVNDLKLGPLHGTLAHVGKSRIVADLSGAVQAP